MKKLFYLTLLGIIMTISSQAQVLPIFGATGCCVGSSAWLFDSTSGGAWSSSNTAIGTISTGGSVSGISAGAITITYTVGASYATYGFTVSPTPAAITCASVVCVGSTITAADATPGGTWSSVTPTLASIGSVTGVITGLVSGSAQVEYITGPSCYALFSFSVGGVTPPAAITGATTVCAGSTITLTDATPGGVWSSVTPSVATISGAGVVTGVAAGWDTVYYTVSTSCGSAHASIGINVIATVSAGTISGTASTTVGSSTTLTDGVSGGTWSSSNTAIATVGAGTGVVTGVSAGTATITYSVTGCGGTVYTTATVTVSAAPPVNRISGHVLFSTAVDSAAPIKVWLIHYDPTSHLLSAIDSVTTYTGGTSAYYQFTSSTIVVTDSYRVKAAYFPTTFSSTGFIPTYYTSFFYWHDASVIYHTAPSADDNKDITMAYGTVTAGPGFIAGDVTTGANKGTTTFGPATNMLVYLRNSTGSILQQTYTDGAGHYSFSNLPVGTYSIYPEAINYATTAYTGINLTTTSSSFSAASFGQHTISKTILPATTGIQNIGSTVGSVSAFPNPTNGKLSIEWAVTTNEKAVISISDVTGREVYSSTINMTPGTGISQVDLSNLTNGTYLISVKSENINYNNKIELAH